MPTAKRPAGGTSLRKQAESLLDQAPATTEDLSAMSAQDIAALVHELRVHQIELQAQNDELRRIQAELETARDRYAHLYDFAPVGYFTVNDSGIVAAANLTTATLLQRPRQILVGQPFSRFIHQDDANSWYSCRKRLLKTGDFQSLQVRLLKNNCGWFDANLECTRVADSASARIRIAAVDITGLKQAEEALRQVNATLEQRVAERTALAETRASQLQALAMELMEAEERERRKIADLLHEDLQQNLACAKMQLETASSYLPPDPNLTTVQQLIDESIAKSRSLAYELSPAVLRHADLRAALQWLARRMDEQFGLHVQLKTDGAYKIDNLPLKAYLFRAVQELLFNVIKHAGVKSAQVTLFSADRHLVINVDDQGRGIEPNLADFPTKGIGFGLLSLRERASYLGGALAIERPPGQGSRLTLSIPLSAIMGEIPLLPVHDPKPPAASSRDRADKNGIRVLFVDDHQVMRQGLIQLMSHHPDIQVVGEAADGQDGIEQVRRLKPDVVVMDVAMPGMDGKEATRRIKIEMPEVRVIGLSMYEDEQIAQAMRQAGADAFVSKSGSSAELVRTIRRVALHDQCAPSGNEPLTAKPQAGLKRGVQDWVAMGWTVETGDS